MEWNMCTIKMSYIHEIVTHSIIQSHYATVSSEKIEFSSKTPNLVFSNHVPSPSAQHTPRPEFC